MQFLASVLCAALLVGCTTGAPLAPGLSQRMDQPGAQLDRSEALNMVNQFRATQSVAALQSDAGLDLEAQKLAAEYARSGAVPGLPSGVIAIRTSAGYANFAETFSGWRNSSKDAAALLASAHRRAGIGVAYGANSTFGVHWVMLFSD